MKFPIYITTDQGNQLQYEVLSQDFYIYLTRHLLKWAEKPGNAEDILMRKNKLINLFKTISGGKIYVLNSDDWGNYEGVEYAWHDGNFLLIFRGLSTVEFIELCCDLITLGYLKMEFVNEALKKEGASFTFNQKTSGIEVVVFTMEEIEAASVTDQHVNIRTLVDRMDNAYKTEDYASVLHSSASIFETMAKEIIGISSIQDKTLKSFFDRYRADSRLPKEVLDYILATYDKRNMTALAGHGSLTVPNISKEEAIILIEMTKAFVRIEYRIQREI